MKHIKLFEDFVNEQVKDTFHSHKTHNPTADILQRQLDRDTQVTYGIYIKDSGSRKNGEEFMELYVGSNYSPDSTKRSYSRLYTPDQIPAKYKSIWNELRDKYHSELKESAITEAKKEKFILYTNPGNLTNAAYVAIGAADVKDVLSSAKRYSDSYTILYQGSGTQDDLVKAKQMFSNYRFGNESINEAKSIQDHIKKANEYKADLMKLKKEAKGASNPQAHAARIEAKEEQLRRVADVIRNLRAEGVKEELTEAKDLRSLQRSLDKLQNDYEAVLDDEALDAMTQLITTINSKL